MRTVLSGLCLSLLIPLLAAAGEIRLEWDHRNGVWHSSQEGMSTGLDGIPTLHVRAGEKIVVVVTNTNPLFYSVARGESSAEPISQLGALEDLLSLVGGSLADMLKAQPMMADNDLVSIERTIRRIDCAVSGLGQQTRRALFFIQQIELEGEATYQYLGAQCDGEPINSTTLHESFEALYEEWQKMKPATVEALAAKGNLDDRIRDVLGSEDDARGVAARLQMFEARLRAASDGDGAVSTSEVRRELAVAEHHPPKWSEIETHSFTIQIDSPYAREVEPSLPDKVELEYRLAPSSARLWDVSLSLVHSDVTAPEFDTVEVDGESRVAVVDEESRSGEPGLFLEWAAGRQFCAQRSCGGDLVDRIGLQLGAGLDKDHRALFFGPSITLGPIVRLGGGVTRQRVKRLDGQRLGDIASDVRVKDDFTNGWYLSLNVALGGLNLFGK